jgi:very-short-patch-repair endonuclease
MESPELIERCRELRKNPTEAEALLWNQLRNNQLTGWKFRRQQPMCGFILDFYCYKVRLGIELDGEVHNNPEQMEIDKERTLELNDYGIEIIRFWNSEVVNNIENVLERIMKAIELRKKQHRRKIII